MVSLAKKVALITGASKGIGAATAVEFAKRGSRLILAGRDSNGLENTKQDCIKEGLDLKNVLTAQLDNRDDKKLKELVVSASSHYGQLDILVNNAGMGFLARMESTTMEQFDQTFSTNVRATMLLTQLCLPHLKLSKGSIVNVGSITALNPIVDLGVYSMSKAAVAMMTKALSVELGPYGIRTNAVLPGVIKTDIFVTAGMDPSHVEGTLEEFGKSYPNGRVGSTEEVAKIISFLASDAASLMNGSLVTADGGSVNTFAVTNGPLAEIRKEAEIELAD